MLILKKIDCGESMQFKVKQVFLHIFAGVIVVFLLLVNAFVVPEPYSHPLIYVATLPTHLMPFLENREFLNKLTLWVFVKQTPNYAPITILFLIGFWFSFSVLISIVVSCIRSKKCSRL